MAGPDKDSVRRLASRIAGRLGAGKDALVTGDPSLLIGTVAAVVAANFKTAADIERQARAKLESLGNASAGMDKQTLLAGIREHLAKEKGFVL